MEASSMEWKALEDLLLQLQATEDNVRREAEKVWETAKGTPNVCLIALVMVLSHSQYVQAKQMAAILLRRCASNLGNSSTFKTASTEVQSKVRAQLLNLLNTEQETSVRKKLCHAVAGVAMDGSSDVVDWPELLPTMFQMMNSPDAVLRESALEIFGLLPEIFGKNLAHYLHPLREILEKSFADVSNLKVRIAASKAATNFLLLIEKSQERNQFQPLVQPMIDLIGACLTSQDEVSASDILQSIIDIADTWPTFLRRDLQAVTDAMMHIVDSDSLEDGTRHLAMEVMVTLSIKASGMMRKLTSFSERVVPLALKLMCDIVEDEDWGNVEHLDDNDQFDCNDNSVVGEQALDRLSCALGGKTLLPIAFTLIPDMLASSSWEQRHAGLNAISAIGEGCMKYMACELGKIVSMTLPFLKDPVPRVRHATCNAIGQMATDFKPDFQKTFHPTVVPALLELMDDVGNPRVQSHAAAALVNFTECIDKKILEVYLDPMLGKLYNLLLNPYKFVQEQAVTTIGTIAESAEEKFSKYYDTFMPILKQIIVITTDAETMIRGKVLNCVSLIGIAVGAEKFRLDAKSIMDMIVNLSKIETDDEMTIKYSAWRICHVMGKEFVPYLEVVIPPLILASKVEADVQIVDPDSADQLWNEGWEFIAVKNQTLGIKTSTLEDKSTACEMLLFYVREFEQEMAPYARELLGIMVPFLTYYIHEGVRAAAAAIMGPLLKCIKCSGASQEPLAQAWSFIVEKLIDAIGNEPEPEVLSQQLESLSDCLEVIGGPCLVKKNFDQLSSGIIEQINELFKRVSERLRARDEEDYDDDDEEDLNLKDEYDDELMQNITVVLHWLFKTHRNSMLPFFDTIVPILDAMVKKSTPSKSDYSYSLGVFSDLIEYCGSDAAKYQHIFGASMVSGCVDSSAAVRQMACYGVGAAAQFGSDWATGLLSEALPKILRVLDDPESRSEDNINATENAASALGKIIKHVPGVDHASLLPAFLKAMPITEDSEEGPWCYKFLCELISNNDATVLGVDNVNLPRIIEWLANVVNTEIAGDASASIIPILKQISVSSPAMLQDIFPRVSPEQQERLKELFA